MIGFGTEKNVLAVDEKFFNSRSFCRYNWLFHRHGLKDFVRHDAAGLFGAAEKTETDITGSDFRGELILGNPALKRDICQAKALGPGLRMGKSLAGAYKKEMHVGVGIGDDSGGLDNYLSSMERKKGAIKEDGESVVALFRRRGPRPEEVIVVANRNDCDFISWNVEILAIIFLVGLGISDNEVGEGKGEAIEQSVPEGRKRMAWLSSPISDLGLEAGSKGVEDDFFGENEAKKAGERYVFMAKFRDENKRSRLYLTFCL